MEGLLHPVGPEEARTYWLRRGAALLVLVLLLIGVSSMIGSLASGGKPVAEAEAVTTAEPVPPAREVVEQEAVPVPTSAATALAVERPKPTDEEPAKPTDEEPAPVEERTTDDEAAPEGGNSAEDPEEPLPPEPENTFHLVEGESSDEDGDD